MIGAYPRGVKAQSGFGPTRGVAAFVEAVWSERVELLATSGVPR